MIIATHPASLDEVRDKVDLPPSVCKFLTSIFIRERFLGWKRPHSSRFVSYDDRDRKWMEPLGAGAYDGGPVYYTLDSGLNSMSTATRIPKRVIDDLRRKWLE
jgi:hypothetical protein